MTEETSGTTAPNGVALDADALRTFVAICESGSFRAAGGVVHRSPAAVSGRMAKLERQLGRPVFERRGRSVRVNDDGRALLAYARRVLALNGEIVARFRAGETSGRVRFGAPDDYGTRWLPEILTAFSRSHPAVDVSVVLGPSSDILAGIEDGTLDVGLLTLGNDDRRAPGDAVHRKPLVWVGAAAGSASHRAEVPLALAGETCAWRHAAIDACTKAGRLYRIMLTCEHSAGQLAAVRADLAVAPLPLSMIDPGLERIGSDVLPALATYTIRLVVRAGADEATMALANSVRMSVKT